MTPVELALWRLVDRIDQTQAASDGGPYLKVDWISDELATARNILAEASCGSPGR